MRLKQLARGVPPARGVAPARWATQASLETRRVSWVGSGAEQVKQLVLDDLDVLGRDSSFL